jgi:hypothetical protein
MTDRRFSHLRRSLRTLLLGIVIATGAPPRAVAGQEAADEGGLAGLVEFHLGVTQLAEVWAGEAGMAALLDVGALHVGGGVWGVLRRIDEGPVLGGSGLELSLGYGGALIEYPVRGSTFSLRLLAGGGAATLKTQAVGARFDTETFVVIEPSATAFVSFLPAISLGALFGYRWVQGADALFIVGNEDLRGPHATVFLRLGGR